MVILTRMKNKQIQYMIAFLKVRQKKKHIRSCVQIYMQETDGGENQERKMEMLDCVKSSIHYLHLCWNFIRTRSFTVKAMILELHHKHHLPYLKCQHSKNK